MSDFHHALTAETIYFIIAGIGLIFVFITPSIFTLEILATLEYLATLWVAAFYINRVRKQEIHQK